MKGKEAGRVCIAPEMEEVPPFAMDFARTGDEAGRWLVVADEEGYVTKIDTKSQCGDGEEQTERDGCMRKTSQFLAHPNAIFDVQWTAGDTQLLTASGDQSVKLWDAQTEQCIVSFRGHCGSVKSVACHRDGAGNVFASGARDGAIMLWDVRTSESCTCCMTGETYRKHVGKVEEAHARTGTWKARKRSRNGRGKHALHSSVTSVLFLRDESLLASSGAGDGSIKFWDVRNLQNPVNLTCMENGEQGDRISARKFGITCLSADSTGSKLVASCNNNVIYLYDVLRPELGPVKSFTGHSLQGFYVKADISPDGKYIVSGSNDANVYIWNTSQPYDSPSILKGHEREVTAVKWSPTDPDRVATCSDDFSARIWNVSQSIESIASRVLQPSTRHNVQAPCTPPVHTRSACVPTPLHGPGPSAVQEEHNTALAQRERRKRQLALDHFFLR